MKIKLIAILCFAIPMICKAQNGDLNKVLIGDAPDGYIGQRADNKEKNGSCVMSVKNGGIYVGDINRNKFNGKGMLISSLNGSIENAPDTYVYVGGFLKGKKDGIGTCYAPNGDIIYSGKFSNDKPVDKYPQDNPDIDNYFSMMETPDGYYIGEVAFGQPNGFGLCIQKSDGAYWIGNSKSGDRKGLCTLLYGPDVWVSGKYKDGQFQEISNSDIYNQRIQDYKTAKKKIWDEFWTGMSEVAAGLSDVGSQYAAMKSSGSSTTNSSNSDIASNTSSEGSTSSSHSSSSNKSDKPKNDCGTSWMSDSRVYSDYESQLIKGGQSVSDRNEIRRKMRQIRQKWEKRGCHITKSPHEDSKN